MTTSYEELIRELREFAIRYGGIPRREIEAIISRHSVAKPQEPLACLADRRGEQEVSYYRGFLCSQVMMDGHKEFVVRIGRKGFQGHSYAEAESKARAYLSSLPDQNKGDK